MADAVILPKLGQTVEEATIVKWCKSKGDKISKGDIIFEIETDKAVLEVESFFDGTLLAVFAQDGETLPVNTIVGYIGKEGEKVPDKPAKTRQETGNSKLEVKKPETAPTPSPEPSPAPKQPTTNNQQPITSPPSGRLLISPRARKLSRESAINPANISGTGPNGRIVVKDVEKYLEANNYDKLKISPAAKKLALKEDIDILTVKGEGPRGKITVNDVKRAVGEKPKPMSKMRQVIARRLTDSFRDTPHFYVSVSIDMTDLLEFRQKLKDKGEVYSVTDFILKAVIMSLEEFPIVNSFCDGTNVIQRGTVELGLAVGLDDGLVVPVIRDAGSLSMTSLHDTAKDLATRARDGKLLPDEMTGSSFTVSNMGMFDVDNFNAIINPGEGAILAVASTVKTPTVTNDKVAVRSIMKITVSVDHRIVDGVVGAQFGNAIKNKLEDLELWKKLV